MKTAHTVFRFEGHALDVTRGCLVAGHDEVELRPKSFAVLRYFLENANRLISKNELITAVWPDVAVTDDSLIQCVREIRLALGDKDQRVIKTVPRRGYLFAAPVWNSEDAPAPTATLEHLSQVANPELPADFPPLKSREPHRHNLPIQLSSFVGRTREIAEVARLVGVARLVTLTGAGGAGKTRLALQVAADVLEHYPDGVWFADLAPLSEPTLVPKAVASAPGIPEQPGRPLIETLVEHLRPRATLLMLDNCEHLLEACAQLADALLRRCPNIRIVATSREALVISGELTYRVPSLSLPDPKEIVAPETLAQSEAVRLFVERAAFSKPGFEITSSNAAAIAQVVQRLDGIPLAIELAAARINALPVEAIAARLDDQFRLLTGGSRTALPRHQTLRATLDWSHDLLSEQERISLQRLSVFAGGFALEAAEQICSGDGIEQSTVLDHVTRLVNKSLVLFEDSAGMPRYRLLETVRQYGHVKLVASGAADDIQRKHRDWYLTLAEQMFQEVFRGGQTLSWLNRIETEHDNMRAALQWSISEPGGADAGLRLVGALRIAWYYHDHCIEGWTWAEKALARSAEASPAVLPRALVAATDFAWRKGDYELATTLGQKGLALCDELGDLESRAELLMQLGITSMRQSRYDRATMVLKECLSACEAVANRRLYGVTLILLGTTALWHGDDERAGVLHAHGVAVLRDVGQTWDLAYALVHLGRGVLLSRRDHNGARGAFREALTLCRGLSYRWIFEECLEGLARIASGNRQWERAARLFGSAEMQRDIVGFRMVPPEQADHDRRVAGTRAALGDAVFAAASAEGRSMTLEQAIEYAVATEAD